jgi:iron complex outermembrane receptor protein
MTNANRPSFMMVDAESAVETTTMGGKLELKWQPASSLTMYSGIDALNIASDGSRTRIVKLNMMGMPLEVPKTFIDKVWQDSYTNDYGVFTEAKWSLTDKTILSLGARYDYVVSDIQDPEDDFAALYELEKRTENNYSGTVSVKQLVSDNFTLEAAWGRGVRSASLLERYINHFTIGQDPYEYVGNPNLKAEVNNQFEIGFNGRENLENGLNKFTYQATGYFSYYQNYITAIVDESLMRKFLPMNEPRNAKVFQNVDKAYKTGIEASLKLDFLDDYFISSEMAFVYAKNQDFNESLPLTPPLNAVFRTGFEKEKYWANVQYNITSSQENLAESFGETRTAGYETMDVKIGFKPFKGITVGAAVINVFDETYNSHLNFSFNNQADFGRVPINEPGRNFSAFAQYTF